MKYFLEKFSVACLYAALFSPLIFWARLMHPLVILKTVYFEAVIVFGFAAYAALALRYPEYRPRITRLFASVCALFVAFVVSSAFGVSWMRSLWSVPERMTGLIFALSMLLFFTILKGLAHRISWERYLGTAVWVGFVVALLPVLQLTFPGIFFDKVGDRLGGTIGNPIFLAAYLTIVAGISAHLSRAMRHARKPLWVMYAVICAFSILVIALTQTRGAVLGFAAAAAIFSFQVWRSSGSSRATRKGIVVVWIALAVFGGVFTITRQAALWQPIPILGRIAREGFGAEARLLAWKAGLKGFADRPILGWGMENFQYAFNAHYDPRLLRYGFTETFFDKPHNIFLQALVEGGIIGFIAYAAVAWFALCAVWGSSLLSAALVGYMVQLFFAFDSMAGYMLVVVVLAYFDASKNKELRVISDEKTNGGFIHHKPSFIILVCVAFSVAIASVYATGWRIVRASSYEWQSINYFLQRYIPEGVENFNLAVSASTPYHDQIVRDLAPNITSLYAQNIPLPDAPAFVRRAIGLMQASAASRKYDHAFQTSLADMIPSVARLDPEYLEIALQALDAAEVTSPRRQATRYVRAKILNLKGDKVGAIREMQAAIALDDQVRDAHFYLGLLLAESGDLKGAVVPLKRAEELGRIPKNADEARLLGGFFGDAELYVDSVRYFERAVLLNPTDLESKMKLGLVYYFMGNKPAAKRVIGEVMKKQSLKSSPQYLSIRPILVDLGLEK